MFTTLGITLAIGAVVGVFVGIPVGRFLERVRPKNKKKK